MLVGGGKIKGENGQEEAGDMKGIGGRSER